MSRLAELWGIDVNEIECVPYRTPACDRHLKANDSDVCPWCECEMYLALLDLIEVEEDHTLARQRFDIARELGYTVEIGEPISGNKH